MIIVLVTFITMMLTPLIATDRFTWWLTHRQPLWQPEKIRNPPERHVLLLGCGSNGMALLEELVVSAYPVVVVDDDPGIIQRLTEAFIPCVRGDVSDLEVLRSAGADKARIVISTIRRTEDNAPVLGFARGVPVLVRGFNDDDLEWIRARGGIPISYAEAAADNFMRWFDEFAAGDETATGSRTGDGPEGGGAFRAHPGGDTGAEGESEARSGSGQTRSSD